MIKTQVKINLNYAGVPGGLVGGPRAYQDKFREFTSHRVHSRFLKKNNRTSGKRESVS